MMTMEFIVCANKLHPVASGNGGKNLLVGQMGLYFPQLRSMSSNVYLAA